MKVERVAVPRVALRVPSEAAVSLGVSEDFFEEHVRPTLRVAPVGRLVLVSTAELDRWIEKHSAVFGARP
jgi:excisionase family DNA binding protein